MKQSVTDIKLVICDLDGCLLPLNKLRYNFYKNLCKQRHSTITKEEFYKSLGNMYTMYDKLPLNRVISSASLNNRVEKDLFNYLKIKGVTLRDGTLELFEYFRQKNIRVAIFSTHKTSRAIDYLKLAGLFDKADYVIGSDTKLSPLPSREALEFLMERYQVKPKNTLTITSVDALLSASYQLNMNSIYFSDLIEPSSFQKELSYCCVHSFFEILNELLFNSYNNYKMFEEVLGLTDDLSFKELKNIKEHLNDVYSDDQEILDIVNKTYAGRIDEMNKEHPRFIFADEQEPIIENEMPQEKTVVVIEPLDEPDISDTDEEKTVSLKPEESDRLSMLVSQVMKEPKEVKEEVIEVKEEKKKQYSFLLSFVYALILSFMIIFIGIIVYTAFIDFFEGGVLDFIRVIYLIYSNVLNFIFAFIFNTIHMAIKVFPKYNDFLNNGIVSSQFCMLIPVYLFNTVIIGLIDYFLFNKEKPL